EDVAELFFEVFVALGRDAAGIVAQCFFYLLADLARLAGKPQGGVGGDGLGAAARVFGGAPGQALVFIESEIVGHDGASHRYWAGCYFGSSRLICGFESASSGASRLGLGAGLAGVAFAAAGFAWRYADQPPTGR